MDQFQYLLELTPQQNYNVAAYVTHFLKDCTARSSVNNFTLADAGLMFGSVYCRSHSLATIDETEKQKASAVTQFLIENCEELFKNTETINKKADKSRETRRKREKDSMMNYNKQESRRAKKAEKKIEKLKKKHRSDEEVTIHSHSDTTLEIPAVKHSRSASSENVSLFSMTRPLKRCLSSSASKDTQGFFNMQVAPPKDPSPIVSPKHATPPPTISVTSNDSLPSGSPRVNVESPVAAPIAQSQSEQEVARTMAKFYQIGFYVMLFVFVFSHLFRSLL